MSSQQGALSPPRTLLAASELVLLEFMCYSFCFLAGLLGAAASFASLPAWYAAAILVMLVL